MAVCMARVSVATLLLRIVGFSIWRRRVLYGCIASTFVIGSVFSIATFLQCSPPRALWTFTVPFHCWGPAARLSIQILIPCESFQCAEGHLLLTQASGWNAVIDMCLAVLPVATFARLQMDKRKKAGLCILMGTGVL